MNQKIVLLIVLLAMGMMAFVLYMSNQQQQQQLRSVQQLQQASQRQVADLNDRLVALVRQRQSDINIIDQVPSAPLTGSQHIQQLELQMQRLGLQQMRQQWLQSSVQLAQQSVLQGDLVAAAHLLDQVQSNLLGQATSVSHAEPLTMALLEALKQDQLQLAQAIQHNAVQRSTLMRSLVHIQQQLVQLSGSAPTLRHRASGQPDSSIFSTWSNIVRIDRVPADTQQHMLSRSLLCQQASFSVGLAQAALIEQKPARVSEYLQHAQTLIQPLSDASVVAVSRQLRSIQAQQLPKPVNLASFALVSQPKGNN